MYEEAQEIFDYLPIEAGSENLYTRHLFGAFRVVNEEDEPIRAFSVLPFHLLFMLAVQYRIYRISAWKNSEYLSMLSNCRTYTNEDRKVLIANAPIADSAGVISSNSSVRNLSKINEAHLFKFFEIIGLGEEVIERAKILVGIRGMYAHANGNIEENIEASIGEYLDILKEIQKCMSEVNKDMQNWVDEIEEDEFPLDDFFRERFLQSQFSPSDFGDIVEGLLKSEKINSDQWDQIVNKGIEISYEKTFAAIRNIEKNDLDSNRRLKATRILRENGI